MSSHNHPCQSHLPTATTTTCCCYSQCCSQTHHPIPPSPQLPTDPLLQALASLLQQQQLQQRQANLYSTYFKPQTQKNHHKKVNFRPQKLHFQQQDLHQQTQFVLSSLLQRINILESSFHNFSTSNNHYHPSYSLKDTAARVIQAHFRAFLVRRSRTLRQLKELAFIKSSFNSLESSISNKTHFDFEVVSHKAMDLLLQLDSIQGGDPMIRDGKRSVSRDLARFFEFVDGFAGKRRGISHKATRNMRFVGNSNKFRALNANNSYGHLTGHQKEIVEDLRNRIEKIRGFSKVCENDEEDVELEGFQQVIDDDEGEENPKVPINGKHGVTKLSDGVLVKRHGGQPKLKKTVTFSENGNLFRVFGDTYESVVNANGSLVDGSDSSDDHGELMDNHCNELEERKRMSEGPDNDEEAHLENGGSTQTSNGERNPRRTLRSGSNSEINGYCLNQEGSLLFSAPVPVKMESRADLMKRKAVKIVT